MKKSAVSNIGASIQKAAIYASLAFVFISETSAQELVGPFFDWRSQDYPTTLAATNCYIDPSTGEVVVDVNLRPEDGYRSGEVLLDLKYTPGIQYPADLENRTITAEIEVPEGLYGEASTRYPSGISLAVKTGQDGWPSTYYTWRNATAGTHVLTCSPTSRAGFDATQSRILVVKVGLGSGSQHSYQGQLRIRSLRIDSPITKAIPPWPPLVACAPTGDVTVEGTGFKRGARPFTMMSINSRPLEYGAWGYNNWFPGGYGPAKHPAWIEHVFSLLARAGHNTVRLEFLTDGRSLFNSDGSMKPFSAFEEDLEVVFSAAARHALVVELSLLDFLACGPARQVSGVQVQGYSNLLTDLSLRSEFIAGIVVPLLEKFGSHPGFCCIDALNEGDWVVSQTEGGDWESVGDPSTKAPVPISINDFRSYVAALRAAIDENAPRVLLTAGVSATSFQSLIVDGGICPYLSYASIHHYPWMFSHIGAIEDFVASLTLDKPLAIEEFPATTDDADRYRKLVEEGAVAGLAVWNASIGADDVSFQSDDSLYSYLVSQRAFAVDAILRNSRPRIGIRNLGFGHQIVWDALPGVNYEIQSSSNLTDWVSDGEHRRGDGVVVADVLATPRSQRQFFRLMLSEAK